MLGGDVKGRTCGSRPLAETEEAHGDGSLVGRVWFEKSYVRDAMWTYGEGSGGSGGCRRKRGEFRKTGRLAGITTHYLLG